MRECAWRPAACAGVLVYVAVALIGCARTHTVDDDPDAGPLPPDASVSAPSAVETYVSATTLQAGDRLDVDCIVFDELGEMIEVPDLDLQITHEPMSLFGEDDEGEIIAMAVGDATVRCAAPTIGLIDETPEAVEIVAGSPASVVTQLAADVAVAGEPMVTACRVFDAFGNEISDVAAEVHASPTGEGTAIDGLSVTATRSQIYEVSCAVSGVIDVESAFLFVKPALPASISVAPSPERNVYAVDDQVTLRAHVRDRFGNTVPDATVVYSSSPSVPSPSAARYLFDADGVVTLTATVVSATEGGLPVTASVDVIVNSSGPDIECLRADDPSIPSDAYMIHRMPGSSLAVPVRVADAFDVASVTIGGAAAVIGEDGNYRSTVPVTWGMNFVEVVATDTLGEENSTTCVFLASDRWAGEDGFLGGAVGLRLDQHAVDDANADPLDSLNDIVLAAIRSDGLPNLLDTALLGMNPLVNGCQQEACPCFGGCCFCVFSARIDYQGGTIAVNGPNTSSLELVTGGVRLRLSIKNVDARFSVGGTCSGAADISVGSVDADVTFDLAVQNGVLRASVRAVHSVNVSGVGVDCDLGFACDIACSLLNGTVRDIVEDALREQLGNFIEDSLGPLLDSVVSSLDVSTLGSTFTVPRLDGSGTLDLGFGLQLSSLGISTSRLLLGLDTRFTPQSAAHDRPTNGIALRQGTILLDPPGTSTTRPVGLTFYEGAVNQILHGLWRGGFFEASLAIGGGSAELDARLPAVARIEGDHALLMLGGLRAMVTLPGVIDEPIAVSFGGIATAQVSLAGDDLSFGELALDELFVTFDASLSQSQRDVLEDFLWTVLEDVLVDAINDGLPAIPIPSFTLPASVAQFGLPVGAELGLEGAVLDVAGQHFRLAGGFGVR